MLLRNCGKAISTVAAKNRCFMLRMRPFSNGIPKASIHITTEKTPNPQSMKYLPGQDVLGDTAGNSGMFFEMQIDPKDPQKQRMTEESRLRIMRSPLAKAMFQVAGVKSIFFGKDFITVTKDEDYSWFNLNPLIFAKISDFLASGQAAVVDNEDNNRTVSDTEILDTDDEIVATIKELLETRIRPSVQEDGGDIFYVGFDPISGIVRVRLAGSCVGCPSSSVTLKRGVEAMLKHYIPEVQSVEDVSATAEVDSASGEVIDTEAKLSYAPEPVPKTQTPNN